MDLLPIEVKEKILVECFKSCRAVDVLETVIGIDCSNERLVWLFLNAYSLVIEYDRIYLRLVRPGLSFIDLTTSWGTLVKLVGLVKRSKANQIRNLIVQNLSSSLTVEAFRLLAPLSRKITFEDQISNDLELFLSTVRNLNLSHKVTKIEINEINLAKNLPFVLQVTQRKSFRAIKLIKIWIFSNSVVNLINKLKIDTTSPYVKVLTTYSLNPLNENDMNLINQFKVISAKLPNVKIFYTLTLPTLDSLNDCWYKLNLMCITKLVLQKTSASFNWCYLNKDIKLHQLSNCHTMCVYVNGISTEYLNKYILPNVNKLTLIFKQYNKTPGMQWDIPANITEMNIFSRGPVSELEQFLLDINWVHSNVRGLSLEYQYNTRHLDRSIRVSLPNTLEQLDVSFFSESLTLICDQLPPMLAQKKTLLCGSHVKDVELVDKSGKRVELISCGKRMVAI